MKLLIPTSQLLQEEQKEQSTSQVQQKKIPKFYLDIENLLELMKHYKTAEKIQLLQDVINQHHLDQLTSLIRSHNWNIIYRESQEEHEFMTALTTPTNYYNIFIEHIDDIRQKTMSYKETTDFMLKWTLKQNIDLRTFILQVHMILRKYHPKKNTLYLQGSSNTGKSYILEGLVPHKDRDGSHITSRDFQFQECLTKPIILINDLTLQNQAESKIYKNILGGEPTYIKVKKQLCRTDE